MLSTKIARPTFLLKREHTEIVYEKQISPLPPQKKKKKS